jgi:hypothetical protein
MSAGQHRDRILSETHAVQGDMLIRDIPQAHALRRLRRTTGAGGTAHRHRHRAEGRKPGGPRAALAQQRDLQWRTGTALRVIQRGPADRAWPCPSSASVTTGSMACNTGMRRCRLTVRIGHFQMAGNPRKWRPNKVDLALSDGVSRGPLNASRTQRGIAALRLSATP